MAKKYYKYRNENPNSKETGDCVIRTLATAMDKSWDEIFKDLCIIAFELKVMPNSDEAYHKYLEDNGFERQKISVKKGSKRPTVLGFTKEHKEGTYILRVANHLTVCKDGVYYDIWDCGENCIYTYWVKSDNSVTNE